MSDLPSQQVSTFEGAETFSTHDSWSGFEGSGMTFRGMDTFSTDYVEQLRYTLDMANIDEKTKIVKNNSNILVNNIAVHNKGGEEFEVFLHHDTKITGNHVDETEIIGTWKFNSLKQLEFMKELIEGAVKKQKG